MDDEQKTKSELIEELKTLRQSETQFRTIYENSPILIEAIDADGLLVLWNKQCVETYGWTMEELNAQQDILELPYPDEAFRETVRQSILDEKEVQFNEWHPKTKTGETRDLMWANFKMDDGTTIGLGYDVTERNRQEEIRRKQSEMLRKTEKMATLGSLVAGVAHEINNPNNVIMLNTPFLKQVWADALPCIERAVATGEITKLAELPAAEILKEVPKLLSATLRGAERIERMVTQLKDYARESTSESRIGMVQINDVLHSALELLSNPLKNATTALKVELAAELPRLQGDFYQLEQVFINLLMNACESLESSEQGIRLRTDMDPGTKQIMVIIEDEGCGMTENVLKHVTDPFFSTKQSCGGTGLGGSISRRIVEEHGGRIHYQSQPGQGTTATVSLPWADDL